jgi:hypothetical protein
MTWFCIQTLCIYSTDIHMRGGRDGPRQAQPHPRRTRGLLLRAVWALSMDARMRPNHSVLHTNAVLI